LTLAAVGHPAAATFVMSSNPTNLLTPGQPDPKMDPKFKVGSLPGITTFEFQNVTPPSSVYLQRDDVLALEVNSNIAAESVTFNIRQLMAPFPIGGQPDTPAPITRDALSLASNMVVTDQQTVTLPAGVRGIAKSVNLNEGYLLSITAFAGNATLRGQTFARAYIIRGGPNKTFSAYMLFMDYPTILAGVGFPGGRQLHPTEGPGWIRGVTVGNPAAGADFILQAGPAQRWRLISLQATLTVANSGAARPVEFTVLSTGNQTARMATNVAAPINGAARVNFSNSGTPSTAVATDIYAQMPAGLILGPGDTVQSLTTNIVVGDQWSAISALVEEWIEGL
jgi:hypothetical protein